MPTMEEISVMTRKEMKQYCKKYKLSTVGKNWVLKNRLSRYIKEHIPSPVEEVVPEPTPTAFDMLSPFDKALVKYNAGSWEQSQEFYDHCLDTWHESAELWIGKGNVQYRLNEYEDSLHSYRKALKLDENSIVARRNMVNVFIALGKYEEAYKICERISTLDGIEEWVWLRMAHLCLGMGNKEKALDHIQKILEVDDNLEEIWNLKGVLLMEKDSEAALRCFNKALELRKDYGIALCNKASVLTRLGMVDEAKKFYDKALACEKNSKFWNNRGILHMGLDENLKALACFGKAIEIDSSNAEAWNNRGTVLKEMKKMGEALECFQNALELSPGFEDAKTSLDEVHKSLQVVEEEEEEVPIEDFLIEIPGIGRKKAQAIIVAGYNSIESLKNASITSLSTVKGVGESLAHTIKEFLD